MNPKVFRPIIAGAVAGALIFAANTIISLGTAGSFGSNVTLVLASMVFGAAIGVVGGIAVAVIQPVIRRAAAPLRAVLAGAVGAVVFFVGTQLLTNLFLMALISAVVFGLAVGFLDGRLRRDPA